MSGRALTPQERALWRRAMREASPIGAKPRKTPSAAGPATPARPVIDGPPGKAPKGQPPIYKSAVRKPAPSPVINADPFTAGDPRLERHVRRGRVPIDAVIDLHGHTQETARRALIAFLTRAREEGRRCVLVITGKGAPLGGAAKGRGVLRARFRDWLGEASIGAHVTRAAPAHARHGGGGAFYVFLRKPERRPSRRQGRSDGY